MKCPYCGSSEIIWDYKTGDIICLRCASVIDKVFYADQYETADETIITPKSAYYDFFRKLERYKQYIDKMEKNREKVRKMVTYNGALIRESSLDAMKIIENNEKLLILYDVIDSLPQFKSKNSIYKLAIGLYFYDRREFYKLRRNLNISDKYMKKILSKLKVKDKLKIQNLLRRRMDLGMASEQIEKNLTE